ncbi:hypothetical protein ACFXTH_018926 [Malus domestica]
MFALPVAFLPLLYTALLVVAPLLPCCTAFYVLDCYGCFFVLHCHGIDCRTLLPVARVIASLQGPLLAARIVAWCCSLLHMGQLAMIS